MAASADDSERMRLDSVRETARSLAPDHYIAALLAPASQRDALMALAALWGETGRIALSVSEAGLGEIRLQWWADVLAGDGTAASGHPVADAVRRAVARHGLDGQLLQQLVDARRQELYPLPFADEAAFDAYLGASDGALFRLVGQVRGVDRGAMDRLADLAARSWGRVRVALDLPYFSAMGRLPLWPQEAFLAHSDEDVGTQRAAVSRMLVALGTEARKTLADLRNFASGLPRGAIDAVLPVALMEPYLRALETKDRDPLRDVATIAPLTRVTRLTWAHMRGRI
jgi:phytoene synthase